MDSQSTSHRAGVARPRLPEITFERCLVLRWLHPWDDRWPDARRFHVIGRLEDGTPFYASWQAFLSVTSWNSTVTLGQGLRGKILRQIRAELADAPTLPAYAVEHDFRSKQEDEALRCANFSALWDKEIEPHLLHFHNNIFVREYLGIREEDFVHLTVPFAEKDEVKALGAKWDGSAKKWKINISEKERFSRWIIPA